MTSPSPPPTSSPPLPISPTPSPLRPLTPSPTPPLRLCYVLLSPTGGMHQYTADLANRMAALGHDTHLVTTTKAPRDRYAPAVTFHTPVATTDTGFNFRALGDATTAARCLSYTIRQLDPDVVHVTGPHLWNPFLLRALGRDGLPTLPALPTLHTLHDLHPHAGSSYGPLLNLWNRWVAREADHLLVHGRRYRAEVQRYGRSPSSVTSTRLTHLFLSYDAERALAATRLDVQYEPWALFVGRLLPYKGLDVLVKAARIAGPDSVWVLIAGAGDLNRLLPASLPSNVKVRNRLIPDYEFLELISRCGLVVLPYVEASQSALVAAAYYFRKPVIVTRAGALPEYVVYGKTGWIVPPGDTAALAGILASALADTARLERMGQAGRAWYQRQRRHEEKVLGELYARLARQP